MNLDVGGSRGDLGGLRRGKAIIRIHYIRNIIFNK